MANLTVNLKGVSLKTPVLPASGTFGMGVELMGLVDYSALGGIVTKGISLNPREGNPQPRIWEVNGGIINSIGLQNPGVRDFIEKYGDFFSKLNIPVIVNIFGESKKEYYYVAEILNREEWVSVVEINLSCPNVRTGGMEFGARREDILEIIRSVKESVNIPVWVKLSHSTHLLSLVEAALEGGADAVVLLNTLPAMAIDIKSQKPVLGAGKGGFSGPPLKFVALRDVYETYNRFKCDIVGVGGIYSGEDVVEFLLAGAKCVEIGTAAMVNPGIFDEAKIFVEKYLNEKGYSNPSELVGKLRSNINPPSTSSTM